MTSSDEPSDAGGVQDDDDEIVRVVGLAVAAINRDLQATNMPVSVVDKGPFDERRFGRRSLRPLDDAGADDESWVGFRFVMVYIDEDSGTGMTVTYSHRQGFINSLCEFVSETILLDMRDEHGHIIEWPRCPLHDDPMSVVDLEDERLVWRCGVVGQRDHLVVLRPVTR